ncbi:MAG: PVC-type heme-binding CxxCH protein [Pirellulales bacterium]
MRFDSAPKRLRIRFALELSSILLGILCTTAVTVAGDHGADEPKTKAEIYGQGVRETPWMKPEDEAAGFHLPTGFKAELIAAEPAIKKPMNMAFDRCGRLWLTDTIEYPYPAKDPDQARDSIKVLADEDGDGTFESITTFAEGLNIPIGILPVDDGVLCFSIPNLLHLRDTDGDGKADERKVVLGPFDTTRDTHGMINAIRRGEDGWIYACHGFNNQSTVKAADGSSVTLISGNTFRFREDGSHVEQFTQGQVNPFGMTADDWGNWFTADCHSKPVTLLVQGGCYESFGRPHSGLGFVPSLMNHLHGSTAICGITYVTSSSVPAEFRSRFYSGNVMTSRINTNSLAITRDTITLKEEADFMTSDDPWFRPVDIQLGPDGAMYVADFYNKIIGHYEVPLTHPERDRNSGRLWRIRYVGTGSEPKTPTTKLSPWELLSDAHLQALASDNAALRQQALDAFNPKVKLTDVQVQTLQSNATNSNASEQLRIASLWALHRSGQSFGLHLNRVLQNAGPRLQAAVMKAWRDQSSPNLRSSDTETVKLYQAAQSFLSSEHPQLLIAAAGAFGKHGGAQDVRLLLTEAESREKNSLARHVLRMAAKELLDQSKIADEVLSGWNLSAVSERGSGKADERTTAKIGMNDPLADLVAGILPAVAGERSAEALLSYVQSRENVNVELKTAAVRHAAKYANEKLADALVAVIRSAGADQATQQFSLIKDTVDALRGSGKAIPNSLLELVDAHVAELSTRITKALDHAVKPVLWTESRGRAWKKENRKRNGASDLSFLSSLTLGEAYTGVLSSEPFEAPARLQFWLCGHDGMPSEPAGGKNLVRLVDAATGAPVMTARPPRNDTAVQIDWDLGSVQGKLVRVECVDNDSGNAYAWLAVADFSEPKLNASPVEQPLVELAQWLGLGVTRTAADRVRPIASSQAISDAVRCDLIAAAANSSGRPLVSVLIDAAKLKGLQSKVSVDLINADTKGADETLHTLAVSLAQQLSQTQQALLAKALIASVEGRALLVSLIDGGQVAVGSLRAIGELLGKNAGDPNTEKLLKYSADANAAPSEAEQQITARIAAIRLDGADIELGKAMFTKHCVNCHKLSGVGQLVGPQLDGVITRGADRLGEDILLPHRNVDKAFRMSSLLMEDEQVLVGLVRELPDGRMELIGNDGKSKPVDPKKIDQRRDTTKSLMPDNFAELLNEKELAGLIQFISRSKPAE